jgi:enolase
MANEAKNFLIHFFITIKFQELFIMFTIKSISARKILNSHVSFTNEFIVTLEDGSVGIGASPQGETISIYEDRKVSVDHKTITEMIKKDGLLGASIDQNYFDQYLYSHILQFGRNNVYGLSEAFFQATLKTRSIFELFDRPNKKLESPRICLNILNGGWHAYTNPVLSDFSEFMLVAKNKNILEVIEDHNEIQRLVKEKQLSQSKTVVSGNPVNSFSTRDNREVIEFLLNIVNSLGLSNKYELMIDASAGDLWKDNAYHLGVTDGKTYSSEEFIQYWMGLIKNYKLRFLEDPFREKDFTSWQSITTSQEDCYIIGDNLYSSDEHRILEGANNRYATGAVIKPNQAGTVTAVCRSLEAALQSGQIAITSHRSISTESTFISLLTCILNAQFIKIGPLTSDYSSIVRLNEIIRLTEEN